MVTVTPATAALLEASRASHQSAADAGNGDAPYLDFNHSDNEASAWVKSIFWGGDDPKKAASAPTSNGHPQAVALSKAAPSAASPPRSRSTPTPPKN